MPIASSDLIFKYSVNAAAGNASPGVPAGSLGDKVSTTAIPYGELNNLFDDVSGDENAANESEYRCIFIHNAHPTLTLQNPIVYIQIDVSGGASAAISVDSTPASAVGSSSSQAKQVPNENTPPADQVFSTPLVKADGIPLNNIGPNQVKAIWVRRTAANSAPMDNDGVYIRVEGDTAA